VICLQWCWSKTQLACWTRPLPRYGTWWTTTTICPWYYYRKCSGILIIRNGMIKRAHNMDRRRRRRTAPQQADALTVTWSVSNVDHARYFSPSIALPRYNKLRYFCYYYTLIRLLWATLDTTVYYFNDKNFWKVWARVGSRTL